MQIKWKDGSITKPVVLTIVKSVSHAGQAVYKDGKFCDSVIAGNLSANEIADIAGCECVIFQSLEIDSDSNQWPNQLTELTS